MVDQPQKQSFRETMLGLRYTGDCADIFSRGCVEAFIQADWNEFGYPFIQIFEPDVLREVAWLEGVPEACAVTLRHQPSERMRDLADRASSHGLTVTQSLSLAAALTSISRFAMASELALAAASGVSTPREQFELGWIEFLISNRAQSGRGSPNAFLRMREAAETGAVPAGRVIDACTQGIVWYIKRREVPRDIFKWCVAAGSRLAGSGRSLDRSTISSWYRGLAMVPAAVKRPATTRKYMQLAHDAAQEQSAAQSSPFAKNSLKTYYESALKEHVYITHDFELAMEAGHALIKLDPLWSPSYGEMGDACRAFGQAERAAEFYAMAIDAGPPYLGFHLLQAARCYAALEDDARALQCYAELARMAPESTSILSEGLSIARRSSTDLCKSFESALARSVEPGPTSRPID